MYIVIQGGLYESARISGVSATTPPTTPPPDVLRKLRSRQSQAQKRKSTIMLPLGAPAKRGRGQATSLEMTRPSCGSSKLQKILSRSHSASASRSESPVGFQPVQPAVVNPSGLQPAQLQAISVKLAAASDHPPASVMACSVVSSSRLGQVTDPAVARSIMSKTPRALSLLTSPVGLEDAVARSEPRVTRNRSSTQQGSLPPPLVIGKPGNLKDATNPMVGPKRVAKQPSSALSQAASTKWCATTSAVRDRSVQSTSNGQAQGRTRREDEHPMRNNIVVSRGAENIQAECLDSVLDHDYCRDSLRRVIVDDFDLAISPTKLHGPKPMQKVKSLPVIKADPASALQASSLHQGKAHQGKTAAAAVKDSDVVSAAATASQAQATASASDAATQNLNKPSSQPLPTVDLVSVLKNVQSIQNLFTLENGTLKLHPSVMASMDPASQVMSLVSQNAPPATSVPSSDTAASATVSDTGQNVGRVLQQTPAAPAACLTVHNPMQTPQGQAVAHSSGATTQSTQQLVPAQSSSTVSESSELARETLQKQNDLSQLSSMLQLSHTASARTASKKQSKQPLHSTETAGERIARCSPVPEHQPEISPSWAPGQSSPNACFSHSRQAMNDLEKTTSSSGSACTRIWQSAQNRVTGADKQCEDVDLEKPAPSPEEASNPVINGTADTNVDSDILHCPNSTVDDVGSQALYSMPLFDVEEPPSIDLSDRVVAPIETHSHQKTSNAERCRSPLPLHCPEPSETCDAVEPLQPSPSTLPVIGPEERPRSCSPHDFQASPEAGTSQFHQEDSQHFTDDFSRVWEEHSLNAENEMLFRTSESHHKTVTHTPSTLPSDPDDQTHSVERTSTSKRTRPSRRYRQSRSWKPGSSPIKEDNSGLFNKIPTYYTALSIPTKTGRKQLTAEDAGGISISDFLPADGSPDHNNEKDMMYNKMPPYFSCFTNSTKYDETAPPANFNPASESREPEKVSFSSEQVSYARSRSQRQSASKSPSPARSPRNLRSRGRKGLRKRRRSSSSSASSRSGSRTRSWRTSRRKCRRSPSLSGSSCSSSQSRLVRFDKAILGFIEDWTSVRSLDFLL